MHNFVSIYLAEPVNEPAEFYHIMEHEIGAEVAEGDDWINVYTCDEKKIDAAKRYLTEAGFRLAEG